MPEPTKNEKRFEFLARCIPMLVNEGKPRDQAIAVCISLWNSKDKKPNKL